MKTIRKPEFITFTGIDVRTDLAEAARLSARYPVEWAALLSTSKGGNSPRFPLVGTISSLVALDMKTAVHLCGAAAEMASAGRRVRFPIGTKSRVQINRVPADSGGCLEFGRDVRRPLICQFSGVQFPIEDRVAWLYDPSAGTGFRPPRWPMHPGGDRLVGYAGGIGPHNVIAVLAEIDSSGPYWIDMETHVRTDEWLDLAKCRAVLELIYGIR